MQTRVEMSDGAETRTANDVHVDVPPEASKSLTRSQVKLKTQKRKKELVFCTLCFCVFCDACGIGFLMPVIEVGDGWPQKLRRHVSSSVGDEDGNNQLWSWQERQAFLSYFESSREPLMLLGIEMDARMLKVVAVMLVSAAISFVEFTERDDFPGKFSWDT